MLQVISCTAPQQQQVEGMQNLDSQKKGAQEEVPPGV
jgi:hypothetical protein